MATFWLRCHRAQTRIQISVAKPGAQPDGPARVFSLSRIGAARRLASALGLMRRQITLVAIVIALVALGFVAGTALASCPECTRSRYWILPRVAHSLCNLNALDNGKIEPVRILFESDVDQSLVNHTLLDESWWYPAYSSGLLPFSPSAQVEYVQRAAQYRKTRVSPLRPDTFDAVPPGKEQIADEYRALAADAREHVRRVNEAVSKLAK